MTDTIYKCTNPECRSTETVRVGYNITKKGRFPRRKCKKCGTTFYEQGNEVVKDGS